jgi:DNA polymerase III subunit gamma/tau
MPLPMPLLMLLEQTHLNLARKWRPQTFDTVIGQEMPVRMLKNSLYLGKFFPVYLFAGQRGCGKTTSARIFAAAVNCQNLSSFQQNPKLPIPCLTCSSCIAMAQGNHADFIEIDAASHTGVDNVRSIIESSSYMPLIGQKKIYLIDEAHMLSKAAFNAFLKLLEEPPKTVMFLLATTETQKIPVTVLSRCFQLVFPAVAHNALKEHLLAMCAHEQIAISPAAVDLLLQETDGSVRDAINLLERVRFSDQEITEDLVLTVLGKISNNELITLMTHLVNQDPQALISYLNSLNMQTRAPSALWDGLVNLCRTLLWLKYGITKLPPAYQSMQTELQSLANSCSRNRLHAILTFLWGQETIFNTTNKKQLFLETVLLQLCEQTNIADLQELLSPQEGATNNKPSGPSGSSGSGSKQVAPKPTLLPQPSEQQRQPAPSPTIEQAASLQSATTQPQASEQDERWQAFLSFVQTLQDQLLIAILKQATFIKHTDGDPLVTISLSNESPFFKSNLLAALPQLLPNLKQHFNGATDFAYQPTTQKAPPRHPIVSGQAYPQPQPTTPTQKPNPLQASSRDDLLVIKNAEEWPTASLLLTTFSGKIKKVADS